MNLLNFRRYADFKAHIQFDNSNIGNKTSDIFRPNSKCNGYYILSDWDDLLQSG